jgi:hypothetical protein
VVEIKLTTTGLIAGEPVEPLTDEMTMWDCRSQLHFRHLGSLETMGYAAATYQYGILVPQTAHPETGRRKSTMSGRAGWSLLRVFVSLGTAYLLMNFRASSFTYRSFLFSLLCPFRNGDSGHALEEDDAGSRVLGTVGCLIRFWPNKQDRK